MFKSLALLLLLSLSAFAGNGIERSARVLQNVNLMLPDEVIQVIDRELTNRCPNAAFRTFRVEDVEMFKVGGDPNGNIDVGYSIVLWTSSQGSMQREYIYVSVIDDRVTSGLSTIRPLSVELRSFDFYCE